MVGESLIRNTKSSEDAVQRIQWMLTPKSPTEAGQPGGTERRIPAYDDLTALNTSRLILDSVGPTMLSDMVGNFVDLLGTACVVSEKNGDYALRILSSDWCRFLDQASRRRCGTPDNREAMESGIWHCHESYLKDAACRAIETKEPVDVACRGGIRLFTVPICAGEETVGSISIGYGDPPGNPAKLSELAAAYGVSGEDLRHRAEAYDTRPPFIIDWAKKQLLHLARFIGEIVERKQAEQVLRQSEEKFRALFNFARDAVFIHDLEGRLLEANQGACERLGYSHDELLKMSPLEIDTTEQAIYLERMETLHRQGHLLFETVNRRRDGTMFPVEVSLQLFELAGKQMSLAVCRDITERKRAEAALVQSEKRFSVFMEHLPAAVFIKDQRGQLLFANRYLKELFGWWDCIGKTTEELVPPEVAKRMVANDRKALSEGPMVLQERITDIHGAEHFFDTYKFPIEIEGSPAMLAGIAVDITGRVNTERELANTKILLQSAFSQTPVPMVLASAPEGIILNTNRASVEILGIEDEADPVGRPLLGVGPTWQDFDSQGNRIPYNELPLALALQGITTKNKELIVQRKDGTRRYEIVSAAPIYNSAGEMIAAFAVFPDITERKRAEEALEKRILALTQPLDDVENVGFEDLFNLSDLQRFQDLFANAWGVAALITRPDGTPITQPSNFTYFCGEFIRKNEKGFRNCQISDAKLGRHNPSGPIIHTCFSAGLWGAGASITVGGRHIASWLVGQVRNEAQREERITEYARVIGADEAAFREAFLKVPVMPQKTFEQIAHSLFALANQLSTTAYQNIQQARFIAERKQAEEALRRSDFLLRQTQQITKIGGWEYDIDKNTMVWTDEAYNIHGVSPEEYDPNNISQDIAFYEDSVTIENAFRRVVDFGESYDLELKFRNAHGKSLWVRTMGKAELREDRVVRVFGNIMDITERKQTEEALRQSEKQYRSVIENIQDVFYRSDRKGCLLMGSPSGVKMFGYDTIDEMIGMTLDSLWSDPKDRERLLAQIKATGSVKDFEAVLKRKDGTTFNAAFTTHFYFDDNGNFLGTEGIIRDITDRKRMEEERGKLEAQMREVQKLESLGVLAGGIAHDFNNLLMAILGRADLALLSLSPASPAHHHVEEITLASERAADLCRQMLAYSGKGRFVVRRHDISEIVREIGQILDVSVSKTAMIRYSLAQGLPAVESDATQISQVIMNLITNASEALSDRRGVITVATGVMECDETYLSESYLGDSLSGGKYVYLEVSDTGCGMDAETLSRIFDPFFTTKFTGRGLGLAAVLGIVRGHKGAIRVYSEVGKGTTFKILLPAVEWEPGERVTTTEPSALLQGGGTVLLVDDDPLVLDVASAMLEQLGFHVLTAINGREGLKVFRTHSDEITCVILDLTMPVMGGEEAFRELRNLRSDVRVILSSGYNEQDVTQRFVGRGLAGFIQKPYTTANLRGVLSRALG